MNTFAKLTLFLLSFASIGQAAVTISTFQDTTNATQAGFLSSSGGALSTGGISIGYFTNNTAPSLAIVQGLNPSTAYTDLVALGYIDLRSLSGATTQALSGATTFDWSFADGTLAGNSFNISGQISATVGGVSASASNLPVSTRLYVLGFDAGAFANGFAGSNNWAFVGETSAAGTVPADFGNRNVRIGSVDGAEVWVGTEDGTNVRLAAIPEPSRALLGMLGVVALFVRRRR
jgi:MYXO-CTERM domain-containing protein